MPRAEIASKQALYTLAKLYAELGGKLRRTKNKGPIRASIEHVAATILLLDPSYDLSAIKAIGRYRKNPLFARGECFPAAIRVLKRAASPLSSSEIAVILLRERGAEPSPKMVRHMVGVVHTSLRNHQGTIVRAIEGRPVRWLI